VNVTADEKSSKLASKPDSTGVPPFYYFLKKKKDVAPFKKSGHKGKNPLRSSK
jgi:hypothetical protein